MAAVNNLVADIEIMLKDLHNYDGDIDGKWNAGLYDAVAVSLHDVGIKTDGWTKNRLSIAAEQMLYAAGKMYTGKLDGLDGPMTLHARETYAAKDHLDFRNKVEERVDAGLVVTTPVKSTGKITPFRTDWPKQSECTKFYGKVGTNQVDAIMPYQMCLAWDKKQKINKFSCHKLVKAPIERIFQRTLDHYGYEKIKELNLHLWGGCLNVRKMRGGNAWSMHSWGIAVDMDPDNNQLKWGKDKATFAKPIYNKYWEFVYDEGAISLGKERNYDFMHFQFARL